jgi:hypothetical protein
VKVMHCPVCRHRAFTDFTLRSACASVGIEHNMGTNEMVLAYLRVWHEIKHDEAKVVKE